MFLKSLLDIPKSVLFNFYYLPFKDAIKFPFHVDYRTKIQNMGNRNSVILKDTNKYALEQKAHLHWVDGHIGLFRL